MMFKTFSKIIVIVYSIILILVTSCQNPITVGGELLDDERIEVLTEDFKDFNTFNILRDSIRTKARNAGNSNILLGVLKDNFFGKSTANGFITFRRGNFQDSLLNGNLSPDSLVLILDYGTNSYGSETAIQQFKVYEIDQEITLADSFYSNSVIPSKRLLTEITKTINTKDSLEIVNHASGDKVKTRPQLRLRLSDDLARDFLNNRDELKADTLFNRFFNGLMVQADINDEINSKTFDLGLASQLVLYFSLDDTTKRSINFLPQIAFNTFNYDRSNTEVEEFINTPVLGDSLIFLHGGANVSPVVQFKNLDKLEALKINYVEMLIPLNTGLINTSIAAKIPGILAFRKNDNNQLQFIEDIGPTGSLVSFFDGNLRNINNRDVYRLNITNHIKRSIRDNNYSSDLYLVVNNELTNLSKGIFFGAKHSESPIKITITHTKN